MGKPQEKISCHLSRLVNVKLASGEKYGIIYLAKRMKCKKKYRNMYLYIYTEAQIYRWMYFCKALKEGRCELKLVTGSQRHLLTGKTLRADFFSRLTSAN